MWTPSDSEIVERVLFSDGRTAARVPAVVRLTDVALVIEASGFGDRIEWPYANLRATSGIRRGQGELVLGVTGSPASVFIQSEIVVARIGAIAPHLTAARRRRRVLAWVAAGVAAAAAVGALAVTLQWTPASAIARVMPDGMRSRLGDGVQAAIAGDKAECRTPGGLAALQKLVARVAPDRAERVRVSVHQWDLVNAFTVPGDRIVLTRGLLMDATGPDEVAGVLAHELGHARLRHPEAQLVRVIGLGLLSEFVFAGSGGTAANLAVFATSLSYGRDAERDADASALETLRAAGIASRPLADVLRRMERRQNPAGAKENAPGFLRTHPMTEERVAAILAVPAYAATPALADADWRALKAICGAVVPPTTKGKR